MATLILSTAGSAVAGPIGSAVGAIAGQMIDQRIFRPKARQGPRLGDLAVQTSSYGSTIPKLFGTMRVAGTVIWATDLRERRSSRGTGKGQPRVVSYSYSASFAVALSARPVRAVRRIWADGKLLRGAAGDFKSATGFRLHKGDEDQAPDPLIAAAEGIARTPAFRGTAYAVFEDLQLEDFGNRIPSLTFEVDADSGPVAIGAIAEELSGGELVEDSTPCLAGYAASGDSVRSAIEALADIVPLSVRQAGPALALTADAGTPAILGRAEQAGGEFLRRAAGSVPGEVTIAYHEPARDYQAGLQRAVRGGGRQPSERRALPAALAADDAKNLAERRLAALWAARSSVKLELGWRHQELRPGRAVRLEGRPGLWKVDRWVLGPMSLTLELSGFASDLPGSGPASAGRPVLEPDLVHGPTVIRLLDVPLPVDGDRPWLFALAGGTSPGWRHAPLLASFDGGASWSEAGPTAERAVLGHARTVLSPASSALFDERSAVEVELLNEAMRLEARNDAALAAGANLALIGAELVQFGRVEALGPRRFRLSRLLRGRRGTEWAAPLHAAGEDFALISAETVLALAVPGAAIGSEASVVASGVGDGAGGVSATRRITGETLHPPSPVHLRAAAAANGDILISWVRRSREGWPWLSGSDTPLTEEQERYQVTLSGSDGAQRTAEVAQPSYVYAGAQQTADGFARPLSVGVVQIGTYAASRPAETILT